MKRILVWGLSNNRAGTESVIRSYVKAADSNEYCFDFLCYEDPINHSDLYDQDTNNRVFILPIKIKHPIKFSIELEKFMKEHAKEYYALWFNANDISNIDLLLSAKKHGIEHRIIHSHNGNIPSRLVTRVFSRINTRKADEVPTERWACSQAAGKFMFGDRDFRLIPNMVDAKRFAFDENARRSTRSQYYWENNFVVGTVGRLSEQKNQLFLVELLPRLLEVRPNIKLVLVGEGDLDSALREKARMLGVSNHLQILPPSDNVPSILSGFDVFVLPSLFEGLPLVALEAQFNGLPCVISDQVTSEVCISNSTSFISLSDVNGWVDAICNANRKNVILDKEKARLFDADELTPRFAHLFDLG